MEPVQLERDCAKISFRNSYSDTVIELYSNHDYYITYKPYASQNFTTVSGTIEGINYTTRMIKVRTSLVDELLTEIPLGNILNATFIPKNNEPTTLDFIGVEIADVKLTMSLHLKYISGDYTENVTPGTIYEVTFVQNKNGRLDLVTVIGKLMSINYPYQTFSTGPHISTQFSPVVQARNQNPNCIFTFDCSNEFSSVRIKIDLRDIRAIKEYFEDIKEDEEKKLPPIPEGYSYMQMSTTVDSEPVYVEVIDQNGERALVYGK